MAKFCYSGKKEYKVDKNVNMCVNSKKLKGVDNKEVEINGLKYFSVFDTGSSVNIVSSNLKFLEKENIEYLKTPFIVKLMNGSEVNLHNKVDLEVCYKGMKVMDTFFLLENSIANVIIGKKLIDNLMSNSKFPIECPIYTKNNSIISWSRPIRDFKKRNAFQKLVDELEHKGVIEKSKSLWCHPVVVVAKKDGNYRFTMDLTRLNEIVEPDGFNIQNIQEIIYNLNDKSIFSVLDLKDGFFKVPLRCEDREKISFLDTRNRLFQFKTMPQGFKNSPAIFQRGMFLVLDELIGDICYSYLDDILIFGQDKKKHHENLKKVLDRLKRYNLKIFEEKSVLGEKEVNFLGYTISHKTIKPILKRSEGIKNFETPKSKRDVRKFLGCKNYDRNFISKLSEKSKFLYELLEDKNFKWLEEHNSCFIKLKNLWSNSLELCIPDLNKCFTLEADASDIGLSAVLKQDKKPIAYISRLLKGLEKNYTITEKEFLAIMWAMEKFQYLLLGRKFSVLTDHEAIDR
ncbi:Retrovirus-related Pol polyprotein from transposon 17.6 [Dictyocoela muelleri]|nr:Retrovirus-related Pol polyprotein from transposon 17.6 [Dictyocoela muelleri]